MFLKRFFAVAGLLIACCGSLPGQTYINTQTGIYRLNNDAGNCITVPVTNQCGPANDLLSLALYKDTVYFTTFGGDLKRFRIGVPGSCQTLILDGPFYNAMTVDKNGIIYLAYQNLVRYNPYTNQLTNLGRMPFISHGDMIFFGDKLLMAGFNPANATESIYELNIDNVAASQIYMATSSFFGLISYPVPCHNNRYFGLAVHGNISDLVELDLVNKVQVGVECTIPAEILDAASSSETGLDYSVRINSLRISQPCENNPGSVEINAGYTTPGALTYTLDNMTSNTTGLFPAVSSGQHTIHVVSPDGNCFKDTTFSIPLPVTMISGVQKNDPDDCNLSAGIITIIPGSPNTPATVTLINTGITQSSGIFTGLPAGEYIFRVRDAAGCSKDTAVTLIRMPASFANSFTITAAQCSQPDGSITINAGSDPALFQSSFTNGPFTSQLRYDGLVPGSYYIQVKKGADCYLDTILMINNDVPPGGCTEVYVPDAFSPNNDGHNETFRPVYSSAIKEIVLQIYNRWGQIVYEGKGPGTYWNGRYLGTVQPGGVYVYQLKYTGPAGTQKIKNGTVVLLR